jgi:hypothetical protein
MLDFCVSDHLPPEGRLTLYREFVACLNPDGRIYLRNKLKLPDDALTELGLRLIHHEEMDSPFMAGTGRPEKYTNEFWHVYGR